MGKYCYDYPRPAVTVDVAVLQWRGDRLNVLLIQRGRPPFPGQWALPGGFLEIEEPLEDAAARELREETGVTDVPLRELGMVGTPGRDPRGRTISAVYYAIVPAERVARVQHGDDAGAAQWFDVRSLPALAFDHGDIMRAVLAQLQRGVLYFLEGLDFFEAFTIAQLQQLHEAVTGQHIANQALEDRLRQWGLLEEVGATPGTTRDEHETVYKVNQQRLRQIREGHLLAPFRV